MKKWNTAIYNIISKYFGWWVTSIKEYNSCEIWTFKNDRFTILVLWMYTRPNQLHPTGYKLTFNK